MRFLVIGLGSMGKRRIRCLKHLGYGQITGFDMREDRWSEAQRLYSVHTVHDLSGVDLSGFDAFIVSTPPDLHSKYAKIAIDHGKPAFIEASVILQDTLELQAHNQRSVFLAPSCTLLFHQAVKEISGVISSRTLGVPVNYSFHSGQYLPDWHPWESIKDFYVSKRATGGAREIVPFELTWICHLFGVPSEAKGVFRKTTDLGVDIEDTYSFVAVHEGGVIGNVLVDVVSRFGTRSLLINFENGQIRWNWEDDYVSIFDSKQGAWRRIGLEAKLTTEGYNQNISERMYIDEISNFIEGIRAPDRYLNSLARDIEILRVLEKIESSDGGAAR